MVVCTFGAGPLVVNKLTLLVGYNLLALCAVILEPGCVCIGAYLVGPVCMVYGTIAWLNPPAVVVVELVVVSTLAGGDVSPFFCSARAAAENVPVIPDSVNRGE
jgi:hypothetical protein